MRAGFCNCEDTEQLWNSVKLHRISGIHPYYSYDYNSVDAQNLHRSGKYGYFYATVLSSENDTILPYGFSHIPFYEISQPVCYAIFSRLSDCLGDEPLY